jgi:hypothetical protein
MLKLPHNFPYKNGGAAGGCGKKLEEPACTAPVRPFSLKPYYLPFHHAAYCSYFLRRTAFYVRIGSAFFRWSIPAENSRILCRSRRPPRRNNPVSFGTG